MDYLSIFSTHYDNYNIDTIKEIWYNAPQMQELNMKRKNFLKIPFSIFFINTINSFGSIFVSEKRKRIKEIEKSITEYKQLHKKLLKAKTKKQKRKLGSETLEERCGMLFYFEMFFKKFGEKETMKMKHLPNWLKLCSDNPLTDSKSVECAQNMIKIF